MCMFKCVYGAGCDVTGAVCLVARASRQAALLRRHSHSTPAHHACGTTHHAALLSPRGTTHHAALLYYGTTYYGSRGSCASCVSRKDRLPPLRTRVIHVHPLIPLTPPYTSSSPSEPWFKSCLTFASTYYLPLTTYYLLLTTYCLLLTAYCLLLTAYCLLLTAYCLQLTAYC